MPEKEYLEVDRKLHVYIRIWLRETNTRAKECFLVLSFTIKRLLTSINFHNSMVGNHFLHLLAMDFF